MNETVRFGDKCWSRGRFLRRTIKRHAAILRKRQDDEPDDGIRNCGRRYLLMTRLQNRRANRSEPRDGFLPDGGNYTAAEGWSISSRFGGDSPAFDNFRQSERFSRRR